MSQQAAAQAPQKSSPVIDKLSPEQMAILNKTGPANVMAEEANEDNEDILYVRDLLATGPRVHDLIDGSGAIRPYRFEDQYTWVEVPYSAAIRLVTNQAFEVRDTNNNVLRMRPREGENGQSIILRTDECVAKFSWLTRDALAELAQGMGMLVNNRTKKEDMEDFLIKKNREIEASAPQPGVDDEGLEGVNEVEI